MLKRRDRSLIVIFQIIVITLGIISFSYTLGEVSAAGPKGSGTKFTDALKSNYAIAGYVATAIYLLGKVIKSKQVSAIGEGLGYGIAVPTAVALLGKDFLARHLIWKISVGTASWIIGVAVAVYFLWKWREHKQDLFIFSCYPWSAPTGGANCEKCNQQGDLPCSEYQCRSLGQACKLLNPGTKEEKCAWVNRNDVEYPIIKPWQDA